MSRAGETPEVRGTARPVLDAQWLVALRARFVSVARRRVAADDVEDVVQEALRIVISKESGGPGGARLDGELPIAWCFAVLRNAVGNHYQRTRVRQRVHAPLEAAGEPAGLAPTPLEALESADAASRIEAAVVALATESGTCGRYIRALAAGRTPAEVASEEGLEEASLYRRVYRCRQRLRALLAERGVLA